MSAAEENLDWLRRQVVTQCCFVQCALTADSNVCANPTDEQLRKALALIQQAEAIIRGRDQCAF